MAIARVRVTILCLVGLTIALGLLPLVVTSEETRQMLYDGEDSFFERASLLLWVLLAIALPLIFRKLTRHVVAASGCCLYAAAREASWHKAFTDDSMLKVSYYIDPVHPLGYRLLCGAIVGLGVACLLTISLRAYRRWREKDHYPQAWAPLLLIALIVGVGTKVLDRFPSIFKEWLPWTIAETPRQAMYSLEEGLELLLPILLFTVAWTYVCRVRAAAASSGETQAVNPAITDPVMPPKS